MAETLITLTDIPARLRLGVSADERAQPQEVLISIEIALAHRPGADRIGETVDYDALIGFLRRDLDAQGPVQLIETVADRCAAFALGLSPLIVKARITVKKPSVLAPPAMVAVTVTRTADTIVREPKS